MGRNEVDAYMLAALCEINNAAGNGSEASTPVATEINVVETVGGTTLAPANASGQHVEVANVGSFTIYLRYDGAAPTAPTGGIPVPPGAVWTSPRRILTAVKAITLAGEDSLTLVHRIP